MRAEINEIENRKTIKKINEIKSRLFGKINAMDQPLTRLPKKKGGEDTDRQHKRLRGHHRGLHGHRENDAGSLQTPRRPNFNTG